MEDDIKQQPAESKLTVGIGVILVLILGFFGWVFMATMTHGDRITKLETQLEIHIPQIKSSLEGLNKVTAEIRDDQIRRQRQEK